MASQQAGSSYERLATHHKLKLPDAVAQSIGFMGPVFSIAFLVPLLVRRCPAGAKVTGLAWRIVYCCCCAACPAGNIRTAAYDVNVPFMQLERHGWDIHAV